MKNIIIAGCSRTGKTTLSEFIAKDGFIHYRMDSIKRAIFQVFCPNESTNWKDISPKIAKFLKILIKEQEENKNSHHDAYCFDTCHLYPIDIYKANIPNTIIIFLGYCNIDRLTKLKEIRMYDEKHIWTSSLTDEEILKNIDLDIKYSMEAKKQCQELNIPFFDTSYDYHKVLNEAYNYIKNELNK